MTKRILNIIILILMIANGLFFITNIYVLGNREEAIKIHEDLAPNTSAIMANIKVLNVFFVGLLFLISAYGIIRKKYNYAIAGIIAAILFIGLYIFQIIIWAKTHPQIWISFIIFGSLSVIFGIYSWLNWKKRKL